MSATEIQSILLVDDDIAHRILARRALQSGFEDIEIFEADCLEAASNVLDHHLEEINLVVLDLNLRHQSGLELLETIRKDCDTNCLPVLMLSTSSISDDVQESYKNGANAYVIKASDPEVFRIELVSAARFLLRS